MTIVCVKKLLYSLSPPRVLVFLHEWERRKVKQAQIHFGTVDKRINNVRPSIFGLF